MKLTLCAATGGIGRHLLELATAAGHDVTVLVRNPARLVPTSARVVTTDLADPDPAAVRQAVQGADAVLSGLGPRSLAEAGVTEPATRAVMAAMGETGVRRVVVVSAGPVGQVALPGRPVERWRDSGDGLLVRLLLGPLILRLLRKHYEDLARMEDALRRSGLDWTSVRPPRLTNGRLTARYRTALGRNVPGMTVSRADVAHFMLEALHRPDTIGQTVGIAR